MNSATTLRPMRVLCGGARPCRAADSIVGSEANVGSVVSHYYVVLTDRSGQRRQGFPVRPQAVQIVLGIDRHQILVLAHLPLALQSREGQIRIRVAPGVEQGAEADRGQ